jgi:hypothetical protein
MPPTRPLAVRFWEKVDRRGPDDCWEWLGSRHAFGYGRIGVGAPSRDIETAHRVSWVLHFGPVPSGKHVLHHCDDPPCVNPAHLFLGDQAANNGDMWAKNRGQLSHRRGSESTMAKLSEEDVRQIRERVAAGEATRALGREFGVSHTAIRYAVSGRNWAAVT